MDTPQAQAHFFTKKICFSIFNEFESAYVIVEDLPDTFILLIRWTRTLLNTEELLTEINHNLHPVKTLTDNLYKSLLFSLFALARWC